MNPPLNTEAPPEVVAKFRAMYLDGSWRVYARLFFDEVLDDLALALVRRQNP